MRDDCDPATFNAVGLGVICNPGFEGRTTFDKFVEELTEDQAVGAWRFNPDRVRLDAGQGTIFESRAGEFHTFTKVAAFGGGVVPFLNALAHAGGTIAECGGPGATAPLPPTPTNMYIPDGSAFTGPTAGGAEFPRGTTKWQCCIHPWMRSEVTVR